MGCCSSTELDLSSYKATCATLTPTNSNLSTAGSTPLKRSRMCSSTSSSGIFSQCSTPNSSPACVKSTKHSKSFGYHSNAAGNMSANSGCSNLSDQHLRYTRDTSEGLEQEVTKKTPPEFGVAPRVTSSVPISNSSYDMELYMMTQSKNVISYTSTPLVRQRNVTFTLEKEVEQLPPPTRRYLQWQETLQRRTVEHVHDVSNIPEALCGHFSPNYFPAYTDIQQCENPPKRYKKDKNDEDRFKNPTYIISTDL